MGSADRSSTGGGAELTARVERLAPGGAGVLRLASGEVLLAPGVAPGETVVVERRGGGATLLRVVTPGVDRVVPSCPAVDRCGGCDWMHLDVAAQIREHAAIVRDVLAHAMRGATLPPVVSHAAPAPLGYRTRARLFVKVTGGRAKVGYRAAASHDLAEVDACEVLSARVSSMLAQVSAWLEGSRGEGDANIALGAGGAPVVDLAFRGELAQIAWARLDAAVADGRWAGARVRLEGVTRPASFGDPRPHLAGADGAPLVIAAGGFAQPSDEAAAALALRVGELARVGLSAPAHVLELFAGSGTLSVVLAVGAASFTSVEIDPDAVAAARENLTARGMIGSAEQGKSGRTKLVAADADAFPIPPRVDVVVLDPPRTGAAGAARALAAARPRAIVYVACDPPTLARDCATLGAAGYAPTHIETFELFPQTSHVETVVRLVRHQRPR